MSVIGKRVNHSDNESPEVNGKNKESQFQKPGFTGLRTIKQNGVICATIT